MKTHQQRQITIPVEANNSLKVLAALESIKRNKKVYIATLIIEAITMYSSYLWDNADYEYKLSKKTED